MDDKRERRMMDRVLEELGGRGFMERDWRHVGMNKFIVHQLQPPAPHLICCERRRQTETGAKKRKRRAGKMAELETDYLWWRRRAAASADDGVSQTRLKLTL